MINTRGKGVALCVTRCTRAGTPVVGCPQVKYLDFIFQQEISRIWYKNTFMIESVLYCLFNVFGITLKSLKTKGNSHLKNHGGLDNQKSQRSHILDF